MTNYFLVKIIFLCFVYFSGVCECSRPSLNVGEEFVFHIEQNGAPPSTKPLIVQCVGDSKLTWHTKVSKDVYNVTNNVTERRYFSTLQISEPYLEDTGFFNCSNEQQEMASTYIYVYDGEHGLFSQSPNPIDVKIGNTIVLDCKTTHPNISVTVWKDNIGDITSRFEWSPYFGFMKTAESLQETGLYTCKGDRFSSNITRVIRIHPTRVLQSPSIATFRNSHYVVGYEFSLDCKIPIELGNEPVFEWTKPREDGVTESPGPFTDGNLSFSKLTVKNPTLEDSGTYTCTVYQGKESAEDSIHITVVDKIEPYVNFNTSESNQKGLFVREGDQFKWVLYFRGFPDSLQYKFYNPIGKVIREKQNKASIAYNYEEGMLQLLLYDIGAENFGNYSAILKTSNGIYDSTSVVLLVNATPKVEFDPMPDLFHVNYEASISASILAFDLSKHLPDVSWSFFSHCPRGVGSCDMTTGKELKSSIGRKGGPINRLISSVNFFPDSSGVIECRVKNKYGVNSTKTNVYVSDKNDSLSVSVMTEEGVTLFGRGSHSEVSFVEGDNITLECFMLNFIYEDLYFKNGDNKQNTYNCHTNLSSGECIVLPNASQYDDVQYTCGASNKITKKQEEIKFRLKFIEKMLPSIRPDSNVSSEGTMLSVNMSDAFKIFCFVDGQPAPKITWFKDGINIEEIPNYVDEKKVFLHEGKQTLEFKFAQTEHSGIYMCHVENRVGFIEPFATVTVEGVGMAGVYWVLIAFAIAFIVILILIVVGLAFRVKREGKLRDDLRRNQLYLFEKGNIGDLNKECTIDEQADLLPYDRSFEVEKKRIKLGKLLGAGAFGRVMEADVEDLEKEGQTTRVAVKMCKDGSDIAHLRALTLELKIMVHLGKHLNIVNLMGAHTENMKTGDLWILVEYCKYGNLLKFIQKCRSRFINQIDPMTGTIDSSRMSPSPSDSISQGTYGKHHAPSRGTSVDADGYLETRSQMDSLKRGRPRTRNSSNVSHTDSSATSRPGLYVGNPHYATVGVLPERPEGLGPPSPLLPSEEGTPPLAEGGTTTDQQHYMTLGQMPPHITSPRHTSTTSSPGSEASYHMSPQTEITGLSSPPPFSPTSSISGEFFVDSHGNPITFDSGGVPGISGPLTTTDLVCWAWQVAQGMEYLTKRKVLHGDLAARNLLLAERNVVKISDFGLSREMYKNDIYMKKGDEIMPIKWMAPEAIQQKVFSIQSDVWAFGITLWEMFTLGNTPYPGVPLNQEFTIALENGMRMDKPKFCNDELYDLMHECWRLDPLERPSFTKIAEQLSEMLSPEFRDNYVAMNTVYARKNEEWLEFKEDYLTMVTSPDFRNLHQPLLSDIQMDPSYIPMQGVTIDSDGGVPIGGYLDMNSVKDSDSIFSPRPPSEGTQPPSVFTFSGTEIGLSEDLQSPLETSNLLDTSKQKVDSPSTSPIINNNNNINKINLLNQHPQQAPLYQNLDNFCPYKQKELESKDEKLIIDNTCSEDSNKYYVNLPKVSDTNAVEILNI